LGTAGEGSPSPAIPGGSNLAKMAVPDSLLSILDIVFFTVFTGTLFC
jgi:hypothetical protein